MTPELEALGRRAVACKGWRWRPGMLVRRDATGAASLGSMEIRLTGATLGQLPANGWLPDLSDPATLGCLLALVREAYKDPHTCCMWSSTIGAWVATGWGGLVESYHSEAEALIVALEAAP